MRVFIDTNILIDFVVNREGFSEDADKLFALGITGDIKLMTSALSYVTRHVYSTSMSIKM